MDLDPTRRRTTLGKGISANPPHDSDKRTRPSPSVTPVLAPLRRWPWMSVCNSSRLEACLFPFDLSTLLYRGLCWVGRQPYQYDRLDDVVSVNRRSHGGGCNKCPQPTCVCPSSLDAASRGMWMWALVTWLYFVVGFCRSLGVVRVVLGILCSIMLPSVS